MHDLVARPLRWGRSTLSPPLLYSFVIHGIQPMTIVTQWAWSQVYKLMAIVTQWAWAQVYKLMAIVTQWAWAQVYTIEEWSDDDCHWAGVMRSIFWVVMILPSSKDCATQLLWNTARALVGPLQQPKQLDSKVPWGKQHKQKQTKDFEVSADGGGGSQAHSFGFLCVWVFFVFLKGFAT